MFGPGDGREVSGGQVDGFGIEAMEVGPVVAAVNFGYELVRGGAEEGKYADLGSDVV